MMISRVLSFVPGFRLLAATALVAVAVSVPAGPATADGTSSTGEDALVLDELRGLVFVSGDDAAADAAQGVEIRDLPVLETPEFRELAGAYVGGPLRLDDLRRLVQETVTYCRSHDRPVVDVFVPEQDVTAGSVRVVVMEARVGRVTASNNRWFDEETIESAIRLKPGDKISASTLEEDLAWLNQNPFRRVDAVFVQGSVPGTTDVQLEVEERYPLRPYVSYTNSGNPALDEDMLSFGLNWGNVFDTDQRAGYQYERAGRDGALAAHRLSYVVPLRWRDQLSFNAGHVETDSDLFGVFGLEGKSTSLSARYSMPLAAARVDGLEHSVQAGFDFRRTNNNLEFFGTEVFDDSSDIVQFAAEYSGSLPDARGLNSWYAGLVVSPGGLSSRNEDEAFDAMRSGAMADYSYLTLGYERLTRLPANLTWVVKADYQGADGPLLASEQLGLGGRYSVRGFEAREVSGDGGVFVSNELRGPAWQLPGRGGSFGEVQLLAFVEYGKAELEGSAADGPERTLSSTGLGLRYRFSNRVSLDADYGWQQDGREIDPSSDSRAHLSFLVSF